MYTIYADDSTLNISGKNLFELSKETNIQIHNMVKYISDLKLVLNASKTTILFQYKIKRQNSSFSVDGMELSVVDSAQFLEMVVNS